MLIRMMNQSFVTSSSNVATTRKRQHAIFLRHEAGLYLVENDALSLNACFWF